MSINPRSLFGGRVLNFLVQTNQGLRPYVNLDNAATTPPLKAVEKAAGEFLKGYGSVHRGAGTKSIQSTDWYELAREQILRFCGVSPDDYYLILTGNTTGAMNTAASLFCQLQGLIAVSGVEHSSSWLPWITNEGRAQLHAMDRVVNWSELGRVNDLVQLLGRGRVVRYGLNPDLSFDLVSIERCLQKNRIKVLVLTAASNVTGYVPDIKAISDLVHKYGALLLVDACQFIQHHPINMREMGIDFLAASGHKFYAPYGGGFLIGPKFWLDQFLPYQIGGGNLPYITGSGEFVRYHTQLAHDPGTPNALGMITMAAALKKLQELGIETVGKYERDITSQAFDGIVELPGVKVYADRVNLQTVLPFNIQGVPAKVVAERLNEFGIGVRAGSFCTYELLRLLLGITVEEDRLITEAVRSGDTSTVPGLVRASFALCNTSGDVQRFVEAMQIITGGN